MNCTRGRIGKWYTDLRQEVPFLQPTTSRISRDKRFQLGRNYELYVETERKKTAGELLDREFGEPHFKAYGEAPSIPLTTSHDNSNGSARFIGERTIKISKLGVVKLSRAFLVLHYRPKTATLYQTHDGKWRMGISCDIEEPKVEQPKEPCVIGIVRNIGNVATKDYIIMPPKRVTKRLQRLEGTIRHTQQVMSRRQRPNRKTRTPGSNRYECTRIRNARRQ